MRIAYLTPLLWSHSRLMNGNIAKTLWFFPRPFRPICLTQFSLFRWVIPSSVGHALPACFELFWWNQSMFESPAKARNNDEQKVNSNVLKHETAGNRKATTNYSVTQTSNRMHSSLCSGKHHFPIIVIALLVMIKLWSSTPMTSERLGSNFFMSSFPVWFYQTPRKPCANPYSSFYQVRTPSMPAFPPKSCCAQTECVCLLSRLLWWYTMLLSILWILHD